MGEFLHKNLSVSDRLVRSLAGDLVEAAAHHSYVETFSGHADTFHRAMHYTTKGEWASTFRDTVAARLPSHFGGQIVLAIDKTEDPYYGVPTLETVPWTGEQGITAWWEFIVISLVDSSAKRTVPLFALPCCFGSRVEDAVGELLDAARTMLPRIDRVLLDRGFYAGAVLQELTQRNIEYVMLVPKNSLVRSMADQCRATNKWAVVHHEIEWKAHKTTHRANTRIVIFPDAKYEWCWATNIPPYHISRLVCQYRVRWRIETMFRIQDEARVKTKSRRGIVRYVTFLISLLLVTIWILLATGKPFQRWLADTARTLWYITTLPYILIPL